MQPTQDLIDAAIAAYNAAPAKFMAWIFIIVGFIAAAAVAAWRWRGSISAEVIKGKDATIEALRERLVTRSESFEHARRSQASDEASLAVVKDQLRLLQESYKPTSASASWARLEEATATATASLAGVGHYIYDEGERYSADKAKPITLEGIKTGFRKK